MSETRRKSPRVPFKFAVNQIVTQSQPQLASLVNLSRSGMALSIRAQRCGSTIRYAWLQFSLPDGNRVRALGEMMHESTVTPNTQIRGFRFKYIAPKERMALNAFMGEEERRV